jgi:hypothetical protein
MSDGAIDNPFNSLDFDEVIPPADATDLAITRDTI